MNKLPLNRPPLQANVRGVRFPLYSHVVNNFITTSSTQDRTQPLRNNYCIDVEYSGSKLVRKCQDQLGYSVTFDKRIPGEGNCLYEAVLDGLRMGGIKHNFKDHKKLRSDVVDYVLKDINAPYITNFYRHQNGHENDVIFSNFVRQQRSPGEYANELFVAATAKLLNVAIVIIPMLFNRETHEEYCIPYEVRWPNPEPIISNPHNPMSGYMGKFIVLGYIASVEHYQSLRFVGQYPWVNNSNLPSTSGVNLDTTPISGESLTPDSIRQKKSRLNESEEKKRKRNEKNRVRTNVCRSQETDEERTVRLEKDKVSKRKRRKEVVQNGDIVSSPVLDLPSTSGVNLPNSSAETPLPDSIQKRKLCLNESEENKRKKKEKDRLRKNKCRAQETDEERNIRLEKVKLSTRKRRKKGVEDNILPGQMECPQVATVVEPEVENEETGISTPTINAVVDDILAGRMECPQVETVENEDTETSTPVMDTPTLNNVLDAILAGRMEFSLPTIVEPEVRNEETETSTPVMDTPTINDVVDAMLAGRMECPVVEHEVENEDTENSSPVLDTPIINEVLDTILGGRIDNDVEENVEIPTVPVESSLSDEDMEVEAPVMVGIEMDIPTVHTDVEFEDPSIVETDANMEEATPATPMLDAILDEMERGGINLNVPLEENLDTDDESHQDLYPSETAELNRLRLEAAAVRGRQIRPQPTTRHHNTARNGNVTAPHYLGSMDHVCPYDYCKALKFKNEDHFKCCMDGKVTLPELTPYPEPMKNLLIGQSRTSRDFLLKIRSYNSAFAFASFGAKLTPPPGIGPPCFRICGQVMHRTGALYPPKNLLPLFGQLYIYDGDEAVTHRLQTGVTDGCDRTVMRTIQDEIYSNNWIVNSYKAMHEVEQEERARALMENRYPYESRISMRMSRGNPDSNRYNLPHSTHDVAAIFPGSDGAPPAPEERDIVIYPRGTELRDLSILSRNLDPMLYPLLFPAGDFGWSANMPHVDAQATAVRNTISMCEFYNFRCAYREEFSPIFHGKKLFQQYLVDAYSKIEGERINWVHRNQKNTLRVEAYADLIEQLNNLADETGLPKGKLVILPSSFSGSPRNMQQNYMDAMAIVGKFGKPDLFLTFTCNPKWREIEENLKYGENACDRPDLVARVYYMKLRALLEDIFKKHVLGKTVARVHVIEYQKRGLPHCHLLVHLAEEDKLTDPAQIDELICAELPDENEDPELFNIIKSSMIHGPCGVLNPNSLCMEDGRCSKDYPKPYSDTTSCNVNGHPRYRRRRDGRTANIQISRNNTVSVDNRYVVPYNPWLTKKYNAHINLEACTSLKSVKYLYKYIYKGHDCANMQITEVINHDEVKTYLDARYLSAPEAAWRIFQYPMQEKSHKVVTLKVHLPKRQYVAFTNGRCPPREEIVVEKSMLLKWFELNRNAKKYLDSADAEFARIRHPLSRPGDLNDDEIRAINRKLDDHRQNIFQHQETLDLVYSDLPDHFRYDQGEWIKRKNNCKVVSRLETANPQQGERFFLRMLLMHVPGATSFECLRTVNGEIKETFRDTCLALGLLQDDTEWENTLDEARRYAFPWQLRLLFATILIYGNPSDPLSLWNQFKLDLMDDYINRHNMSNERAEQLTLAKIDKVLSQGNKTLSSFNLPSLNLDEVLDDEESALDNDLSLDHLSIIEGQLNNEQRDFVDDIVQAVDIQSDSLVNGNKLFYLDAPGGTGKTFVFNYLISKLRREGKKVAAAAPTGIAALLLNAGTTLHKMFRLPVPLVENSTSNISVTSKLADNLRNVDVFIFDEASSISKYSIQAVNLLLQDIMDTDIEFGNKIVVLGGDFRQTLPVVPRGRTAQIIEACLKSSPLWNMFKRHSFTQNMRAAPEEREFADWLLTIGDGTAAEKPSEPFKDCVQLPKTAMVPQNSSIIDAMYDVNDSAHFHSRAILTPNNRDSIDINEQILLRVPGEMKTYFSADGVITDDDTDVQAYPVEFINQITPSGCPTHKLNLKVGAVIMLLRNLDLQRGLSNGTRLIVTRLFQNCVEARIITGVNIDTIVFIPRIHLTPSDTSLPFQLSRRQFPVRLAYSMTINKAQGQTFDKVGIFLRRSCFSHGQLYVALSRARRIADIKIQVFNNTVQGQCRGEYFTPNVVYRQILS